MASSDFQFYLGVLSFKRSENNYVRVLSFTGIKLCEFFVSYSSELNLDSWKYYSKPKGDHFSPGFSSLLRDGASLGIKIKVIANLYWISALLTYLDNYISEPSLGYPLTIVVPVNLPSQNHSCKKQRKFSLFYINPEGTF